MSDLGRKGRIVNRADLATLCGVSLPTVDSWVEKGCPFVERGSKGREWLSGIETTIVQLHAAAALAERRLRAARLEESAHG